MTVLKGRKFCTTIDEQIVFSQLEYSESAVWSLFLIGLENMVLDLKARVF